MHGIVHARTNDEAGQHRGADVQANASRPHRAVDYEQGQGRGCCRQQPRLYRTKGYRQDDGHKTEGKAKTLELVCSDTLAQAAMHDGQATHRVGHHGRVFPIHHAHGFIVLPGGFGTLDETFEALTLVQTGKITRFPVVLMRPSYWSGLLEWISTEMINEGTISEADLELIQVTDSPEQAVATIVAADQERTGDENPEDNVEGLIW